MVATTVSGAGPGKNAMTSKPPRCSPWRAFPSPAILEQRPKPEISTRRAALKTHDPKNDAVRKRVASTNHVGGQSRNDCAVRVARFSRRHFSSIHSLAFAICGRCLTLLNSRRPLPTKRVALQTSHLNAGPDGVAV